MRLAGNHNGKQRIHIDPAGQADQGRNADDQSKCRCQSLELPPTARFRIGNGGIVRRCGQIVAAGRGNPCGGAAIRPYSGHLETGDGR